MEPLSGASLLDLAGAVDEPNPSFENTVEESFKKRRILPTVSNSSLSGKVLDIKSSPAR